MLLYMAAPLSPSVTLYLPRHIGQLFFKAPVPPREVASVAWALLVTLLFPFLLAARLSFLSILFFCCMKFWTVSLSILRTCSKLLRQLMFGQEEFCRVFFAVLPCLLLLLFLFRLAFLLFFFLLRFF